MATAYEDLLAQLYGNIGTAGQKFTSNIIKPFMDQAPGVPLQGVSGPSDLQQQYFQTDQMSDQYFLVLLQLVQCFSYDYQNLFELLDYNLI